MSIAIAVALVAMSSAALGLLLLPLLLRRRRDEMRDDYNLAIYRDQLAEIERDIGRGVLGPEQAETARTEIGRRILALRSAEPAAAATGTWSLAGAVIAVLLMPIAALLIYAQLGSPALPDRPFAARGAAANGATADQAPHLDMQEAIARLSAHLKTHPEDLTGWRLLGRSEAGLGHYHEAADAYRHAADLSGRRADIMADWGEALVMSAGGTVTPAARDAFAAARSDPEAAPRARYYLALGDLQQGDAKAALQAWRELAADAPAGAEWLPVVRQRIADAEAALGNGAASAGPQPAGMPSSDNVAAAARASAGLSSDERRTMILGMVGKLAARLEQQPDDTEGWARLGRSYMVLDEPQKARDAYARALRLKPDDPALRQALEAAAQAAAAPAPK